MAHWKHTATRCAVNGCDRTRRKGWTTCSSYPCSEVGVSLYGLKPNAPRLAHRPAGAPIDRLRAEVAGALGASDNEHPA